MSEKLVEEKVVENFILDNELNSCNFEFTNLFSCINKNILDLSKCQDLANKFDLCLNSH